MGLTSDCKQTSIGIPLASWDVRKIREVCTLVNGRGFKPHEWQAAGLPIIRIQNLNGSADFNYYSGQFDPKILVKKGQLLFAWSGSRGTSFGPHIWRGDDALLNYHTWKIVVDDGIVDCAFLYHALRQLTGFIEGRAHGAAALVHTQKREMEEFRIAIPSTFEEQRAIAEALNDVDALLGAQMRLVTKKRDLKQAAMQQLLTGKVRLPGFAGPWQARRLGELGTFLKGSGVRKDEARSGSLACIRYGEIYTHHHDVIRTFRSRITPAVAAKAVRLRKGDLLFAGSGETKGEIGKCVAYVDECEAYAGGDIVILRPERGVDSMFMGYYLNTPPINAQKASMGQGDAVVHIGARALAGVRVTLPHSEEQTAIAAVLSDMDAELTALEARLEKTKALKQAMMQELLTGRTRLVAPEPAHA